MEFNLQDWERELCSRVAEGKNPTQAAWIVLNKFPELTSQGMTARELAKLVDSPRYRDVIEELRIAETMIDRYEREVNELKATITTFQEDLASFCQMSVELIKSDGFDAIQGILKDEKSSARVKVEAMKVLLTGVKSMIPYSGLYREEKTLYGQERVVTPQGMSPALTVELLKAIGVNEESIEKMMRESATVEIQAN